ncbi:tetratricopeptide repeat protein [Dongia sedimenti]|uniref:Tetratricopeptide repeat protein n=1 Tax=Dongia sedimenti TaxID=3064282 RepID=A0ABU0YNC8_9PROT|nr:tetratricopeptide repeat protein [Rhodospirillaceae bacterium R-7]
MRPLLFGALLAGVLGLSSLHAAQAEDLRDEPLAEVQQLADAGRADAQRELGIRYGQGTGLTQDMRSARSWASKAASQGDPWAMRIMGLIYLNGLGVEADRWRAVDYFKRSADAGDLYAQFNLAVIYYEGTLTKQSYEKALTWYKRAADQGNTRAQHNLGLMLANGIGTELDRVEAYKWFELSGSGDAVAAITEMQEIAPRMTKTEIAQAQERAELWRANMEWVP